MCIIKRLVILLCILCAVATGLMAASAPRTEVTLHTTHGDITVALYNETPMHRDNFVRLCREHFFDSLLFHRVIRDFMIQGGDPDSKGADLSDHLGEGGPGYDLPAEIRFPQLFHKRGVLAAAREGDDVNPKRMSSGSQFYIVWGKRFSKSEIKEMAARVKERTGISMPEDIQKVYMKQGGTPHLDGQYTVFGEVTDGLDVVDKIQRVTTTDEDRPRNDVIILSTEVKGYIAPEGKEIYIPRDLRKMDLQSDTSQWSFRRMKTSENFAVFWERGFGPDLSQAPDLNGKPMKVDLDNLINRLEHYYAFYRDTLQFIRPGSKAEHYRMMVMIRYSLEGTAYGGDYDGQIGALWVAPNRLQDRKLNCIAHELGHSFQSQVRCDGLGGRGHLGGFHEMTSQWMLWQVNPQWMTDENYHWKDFMNRTHLRLFDRDNIYHSPYVLEYWGWKHSRTVLAELYRQVRRGEDPAQVYMRVTGQTQEQFNEEMLDCYRRLVTYDMPRVRQDAAPYANRWHVKSRELGNYGFNVETVTLPQPGQTVTVSFKGEVNEKNRDVANWKYGFVAVTADGTPIYGATGEGINGTVAYTTPKDMEIKHLWLVVTAAPKVYRKGDEIYPYNLSIE